MRVMPLTIYDLVPLQWYFGHSQLHIGDTVKYQFNVKEAGSVTSESIPGSSAPEERRFFCAEDSTAH